MWLMAARPDRSPSALVAAAIDSDHVAAKAARFAAVGVVCGLVYALATALAIRAGMAAPLASAIGYLVSVPLGYVGHRRFTFRSANRVWTEALRFLTVHVTNIVIVMVAMQGLTQAGLHWIAGVIAAVLLVPVVNFLFAHYWVFRPATGRP